MDKIPNSWNIMPKNLVVENTSKPIEEDLRNNVTTKQGLTYLYRCFQLLGIYRTQNYQYIFLLINGCVAVLLPAAFVASYFLTTNEQLDYGTLLNSIQAAMSIFGCSGKNFILFFLMPQLLRFEKVVTKLDERCVSEDEVALLVKLKTFISKLVICYVTAFWSYSISALITSILAGHPPYALYIPGINWRRTKWEFYVASIIEFTLISVACLQQVANDSYAPVYIGILRAHTNILCLRIRKLCSNPDKSFEEHFEELKECIKDHKNLIQLYEIISPVISTTVFMQFTMSASILGVTLINILIFAPDFASAIASSFYILALIVEIFPLCYYANCLIEDSNQLSYEIFHSPWIEQNPHYRKMLIFFIQRSQKPMQLSAGKMFPINLNSFISIAKFSFSLYTLIKAMGLKEKLGL